MKFVFEDPGGTKTQRENDIELSKVRAHVARIGCKKRQRRLLLLFDPYARVTSTRSPTEWRYLQFYQDRTAQEWPNWSDRQFFTTLVPRLAETYPCLSHNLIAIASYHEALETRNEKLQEFAVNQGRMSIAWFNEYHCKLPLTVLLAHCIVTSQLSRLVSMRTHQHSVVTEATMIDLPGDDVYNLKGLLKRSLSRLCRLLDPLPLLGRARISSPSPPPRGTTFSTLLEARDVLEEVLTTVAVQAQNGSKVDNSLLQAWLDNFEKLRKSSNFLSWFGLKVAYGMSLVQIETMHCRTQTVYDQYLDIFEEVANAFEVDLARTDGHPHFRFGVEGGLQELVRWAAIWCRDPSLRRRIINLMFQAKRTLGYEYCHIWARIVQVIMSIEETGIMPCPTLCTDIPENRRIRPYGLVYYQRPGLFRLDFLRFPYNGNIENIWILPSGEVWTPKNAEEATSIENEGIIWVLGPGYVESPIGQSSWHRHKAEDFYFVIPKI